MADDVLADIMPPDSFIRFAKIFGDEGFFAAGFGCIPRLYRLLFIFMSLKIILPNNWRLKQIIHAYDCRLLDIHFLEDLVALHFLI